MSQSQRTLFGTDGIRGKAGVYPLVPETMVKLGQAAADVLLRRAPSRDWPIVVIGKDTRQSGDMLELAIAAGLNSRGVDVRLAGVVPTPAIAMLTRSLDAVFGIVISASHNPFGDNGVKFFGADGYKLDDEVELAIEQMLLSESTGPETIESVGRTASLADAADRYVHFVTHDRDPELLSGMRIILDASNGAAYQTSPKILEALGAEVQVFHDTPSGININAACGCTHGNIIEDLVKEHGAHVGVSHDGDADRVLLCDESGSVVDGDELMTIAAISMLAEGTLKNNTLVTTVMSNAGLDQAIKNAGGQVIRTNVGDRYVVAEMKRGGFNLGGEQSGHFIFLDANTTGDGVVSAVELLAMLKQSGKPLSELRKLLKRFPQVQRNVRVNKKLDIDTVEPIAALIKEINTTLGDAGRTLLRYSGTEPLLRILVEGEDQSYIEQQADALANAAQQALG